MDDLDVDGPRLHTVGEQRYYPSDMDTERQVVILRDRIFSQLSLTEGQIRIQILAGRGIPGGYDPQA